ncbi:unnamed protein product [Periconia digitata]|uniref:Uncharacterized protein n=1 Tax=Periconia digitata TaxID=1303443 RepID=A0A9W4UJX2_9PLEO|nr:unnamed protein product [Periconia digitata]
MSAFQLASPSLVILDENERIIVLLNCECPQGRSSSAQLSWDGVVSVDKFRGCLLHACESLCCLFMHVI